MEFGITLFIVAVLIIVIWVLIEIKRLRHKIFAMFLIFLILFTYVSFTVVIKDKQVDFGNLQGWMEAGKLYLSWLGSLFVNFKTLTTSAIKMDWKANDTLGK